MKLHQITESFNAALDPYDVVMDDVSYFAGYMLPDGSRLAIRMSDLAYEEDLDNPNDFGKVWDINFNRDGEDRKTGQGHEQTVFACVMQSIRDFVEHKQPVILCFQSRKDDVNRTKLYERMIARYAGSFGYSQIAERQIRDHDRIPPWFKEMSKTMFGVDNLVLIRN